MMFGLRSGTVTFDLNDPSMVLPRRFRGKRCCDFVLRHVTGRGKATPRPRRSPEEVAHRRLGSQSVITMTAWPVSGRPMSRPFFPSHFTESGGWTRGPIESPGTPPRWRVSLAGEAPTTAAARRHPDAPAGD